MANISWRAAASLFAFSLVLFLITAGTYNALGVVLPTMVTQLHWGWTAAGLGFTMLGAATGASSFIPSWLIMRFGVRPAVILGGFVMAAGFGCLAEARGVGLYIFGCGLCGVGFQMLALIPGTHVLAGLFKHRALPFGVYFAAGSAGGVAGPLMVLGLMKLFAGDWRLLWASQAVLSVLAGLICAALVGGKAELAEAAEHTDEALADEIRHGGAVYRTPVDWTARQAVRTPQFYLLLAAYFAHLLIGATVGADSIAHLTQRGASLKFASAMLSFEALMQIAGRSFGGLIGDRIDPRWLLLGALASLAIGAAALGVARDEAMMLVYAIGSGVGFGLTLLSVTVLLLNYYGRKHNLEIFTLTCLIGTVSALGPTVAGAFRDATGSFTPAFEAFAGLVAAILVAALFMRPPRPSPA